MAKRQLTVKQQKFADEYIEEGNATKAALAAGYSKKYAAQNSDKLLKNTNIAEYIAERMQQISNAKLMDAKEVLETLAQIARGEIVETTVVTLKKPTLVAVGGAKGTYEKLTYTEEAQVFESPTKNADRVRALELIGKRHMLWTDKQHITVEPVNFIEDVPEDDDNG